MKLKDNAELSMFDGLAMVAGFITQDKHHFFNKVVDSAGQEKQLSDFLGGTFPKLEKGQRIPMNVQTNNPSLTAPTVTAQKYFGQLRDFKMAVDQILNKKIGIYPTNVYGAGMGSFNMLTSAFGSGSLNIQSIISQMMFGNFASSITQGSLLFNSVQQLSTMAGQAIGADLKTTFNTVTDASRILQAASAAFAGSNTSPFSASTFSDGLTMAKDVQAYIKKLTA